MCDNAEDRCIRVLGCNSCGNFTFRPSTLNESQMIVLDTKAASNLVLYINYSASQPVSESILRLSIGRSNVINTLAQIIGWIYFFAWSISFYPQIWLNFTRQNVSGLSFDFLALNITGFLFYGIYNVALYFGASFQSEYFASHPFSQIPVEINDVVFAVHACFATIATVIQCFIYERDGQRVSLTAKSMVAVFWAGAGISLICTSIGKIAALTFISLLSYIKLLITLTKYVPQAFLNYRRKSTIGWSIGNVLLDFTGGVFSILQIILLNYNFGKQTITQNWS